MPTTYNNQDTFPALRFTQYGIESQPGTRVVANRQADALSFETRVDYSAGTFRPEGLLVPTASTGLNSTEAPLNISGILDYETAPFLFSLLLGTMAVSTPGGATNRRRWTKSYTVNAPNPPATVSLESGPPTVGATTRGASGIFGFMQSFQTSIDKDQDRSAVTGEGMIAEYLDQKLFYISVTPGGTPSGTFTATFGFSGSTETTAGINHDATAAAVQAALEGLADIATGDVACTGGPLGTAPVAVFFTGQYARTLTPPLTLDGAGLTDATVGLTKINPTSTAVPAVPIIPRQWSARIAETHASLDSESDSTELLVVPQWSFSGHRDMKKPLNRAFQSYQGITEGPPTTSMQFRFGFSDEGMANMYRLQEGTRTFVRLEAQGPIIEGSDPYRLQIDHCLYLTNVQGPGNLRNLATLDCTGVLAYDPTWDNSLVVTIDNTQTAL